MTTKKLKEEITSRMNCIKGFLRDAVESEDIEGIDWYIGMLESCKADLDCLTRLEEEYNFAEENNHINNLKKIAIEIVETKREIIDNNVYLQYDNN